MGGTAKRAPEASRSAFSAPVALAVTLLFAAGEAAAAEAPVQVRLQYSAPAGCPDEAWVRGAVIARLGRDPFSPQASRLAEASIRRAGGRFLGLVRIVDAGRELGRRELDSTDCLELASSLELALAIAIDPRVLLRQATPAPVEPPPPPPSEPAPPPPAPAPPPPAPVTPPSTGPQGWVGLQVHVATGWLPGWTVGTALQAGLRWEHVSVSLQARTDVPTGVDRGGGRSARVWGLLATALPCAHLRWLGVCLAASAGALEVTSNVMGPIVQWNPVVLIGARVQAGIALGQWWQLTPFVEGQVRVLGATVLSGDQELWSSPVFAFAAGLAVAVRFL